MTFSDAGGERMSRYFAEFIGTFVLVFAGCRSAVLAGDKIGFAGIALAFGLALLGEHIRRVFGVLAAL
jgi:aquaporin Z